MKKVTQLILALVLLLSLCGCNSVISDNTSTSEETDEERTEYDLLFKDEDLNYSYSDATYINLTDDEDVKINSAGTYVITGESSASIIVDVSNDDEVKLVLDNVTINSDDFAAIYVVEADKVTITLADDSINYLSDSNTYTQIDENTVDAVIFSKADLVINGNGSLNVEANYQDGIVSKDDLIITGGTISVDAQNGKGIVGKDCVKFVSADLTVNSLKDSIKSNNEEDEYRGYIYIASGNINVNSFGDGIYGYNLVEIDGGTINVSTTTNSNNDSNSLKGIKSDSAIIINDGGITIDSKDDSIHTNGDLTINGGSLTISSGDDGLHADVNLTINGGTINILESYEGIEGQYITLNDGDISLVASDDGINAADGSSTSNEATDFGNRGNKDTSFDPSNSNSTDAKNVPISPNGNQGDETTPPTMPSGDQSGGNQPSAMPSGDQFGGTQPPTMPGSNDDASNTSLMIEDSTSDVQMMGGMGGSTDASLTINGGTLYVNAGGDGLDSNGTIVINGGNITVDGPSDSANCALDYETSGNIYGGEIILVGSSGMAESFSSDSTQCNLLYNLSTTYSAGTDIVVLDSDGNEILSMTSAKSFNSLMLSSSKIEQGDTITIKINNDSLTYTFESITNSSGGSAGGGMFGGHGGFGH